ncbi:MAG: methyltransferase domain-containing protein [Proteobacteria bacterium]|nr:methyltransferase domain-containing protein [Pseudomonadota bacterium]
MMRLLSEATALPPRADRIGARPPNEKAAFLRGLIARPLDVSALMPSSKHMARAMAELIPGNDGPVLELGPGTGAVTDAIIEHGVPEGRIVAIECNRPFIAALTKRFPRLKLIEGDASQMASLVGGSRERFSAVVSGLPLINLPMHKRRAIIDAALARLKPGAPFIQISYRGRPAVPASPTLSVTRARRIWRNLPPGYVWVYRRREPGMMPADRSEDIP